MILVVEDSRFMRVSVEGYRRDTSLARLPMQTQAGRRYRVLRQVESRTARAFGFSRSHREKTLDEPRQDAGILDLPVLDSPAAPAKGEL